MNKGKYIKVIKKSPLAPKRMFCFPYAGGSASIYKEWADKLYPNVELCAIQMPGREERICEEILIHIEQVVEEIYKELQEYSDKPFGFFGHSLGALISYEIAKKLFQTSKQEPYVIFVSGCGAPHVPPKEIIHNLPEEEFEKKIFSLGGTPQLILENKEILSLFLPILRSDFTMVESYECKQRLKLHTNIIAFSGKEDKEVELNELLAWNEYTNKNFSYQMFPGGHFFIKDSFDDVINEVKKHL